MHAGPDHPNPQQRRAAMRPISQEELMQFLRGAMPVAVICIGVLALLYTFYFAADLFLPVFIAIFFAIVLRPPVRSLNRLGLPNPAGALIVLASAVAILVLAMVNLSSPADEWLQRLPEIQREVKSKLWPVTRSIEQAKEATEEIQKLADGANPKPRHQEVTVKRPSMVDKLFESTWFTFVQALIIIALTFFFLARDEQTTRRTIRRLPLKAHREHIEMMFDAVQQTVTRYLRISAMIYFAVGILTTAGMLALGLPNPFLWGGLAFLLGFVPYVGPLIVFGCISAVSLLTFDSWVQIILPPLYYGILTVIEGYFITPGILGRRLTVSPVSVFLSMLLWTWVWGAPGALLSVPILVIVVTVGRHFVRISREEAEQAERDGKSVEPVSEPA
jgi:predicted PurR-regulated permease PerM